MRGHHLIIAVITTLVVSQLDSSLAIECFNCTSSSESDACITNVSGQLKTDCPDGECFTSTDGSGKVTRGCLPTGTNCTGTCQTCSSAGCNTNAVCYSCTGDSCNTVTAAMYSVCAADSSKCYTTGSSTGNMTRGCTADSSDPSFATCDASLCNNLSYERSNGSCITCTDCAKAPDVSQTAKACTVLYNETFSGCYATEAGVRGCLNSLEGDCTAANKCQSCTEENCNTAGQEFKCISCLSNKVPGCWSGTGADLPSVACPNGTCFGGVWNGLGVRDCLTGGSELMQYQCVHEVEPYRCTTCKDSSLCNNVSFNGAGEPSQMGVVGLLLGLMAVLRSA